VSLTKSLRWDIQNLGQRLAKVASGEGLGRSAPPSSTKRSNIEAEIKVIIADIRALLNRIEDAVPLINLAITTSGINLSTTLPQSVSPSRLLQASTFLTAGDTQYSLSPGHPVQVGPTFTLSVYLLFAGHVRPQDEEGLRNTTWKEAIHKARVKLRRVPMDSVMSGAPQKASGPGRIREEMRSDEFAYQLLIIEDLDDRRVHTFDDDDGPQPGYFEGVPLAGLREVIPIHQISKIFYADTGKILNIGSDGGHNSPVLLLKRDLNAIPPRRLMIQGETAELDLEPAPEEANGDLSEGEDGIQAQIDAQIFGEETPPQPEETIPEQWRFPPGLDLEWIAFEVYQEPEATESETEGEEEDEETQLPVTSDAPISKIDEKMGRLKLEGGRRGSSSAAQRLSPQPQEGRSSVPTGPPPQSTLSNPMFNQIRTSLSLLETLLRLTSLQQFQQQSHLSITDELLNFFLEESSTTGAGGDEHHRRRVRAEARRKVGWDPYDESPLKRRGEEYQYQANNEEQDYWAPSPSGRYRQTDAEYTPSPSRSKGGRSNFERASPSPSRRGITIEPPDSPSSSPSLRGGQRSERKQSTDLRRQIPATRSLRRGSEKSPGSRWNTDGAIDEGIGSSPG
jgi:hypothetical protein